MRLAKALRRGGAMPPEGERALEQLAVAFVEAEEYANITIAMAAAGGKREALTRTLEKILGLRRRDFKSPILTAYLWEHPRGHPAAVQDLAGSLALKLDRGVQEAAASARAALRAVEPGNVAPLAAVGITAHVDDGGRRWGLGRWAIMSCETLGRAATSRGVRDAAPAGATVTVSASGCGYCQQFNGDYPIAEAPWPPFHASCRCTASVQ